MSAPLFYLFIAVQVLIGYNLLLPAWLLLCSVAWCRQAPVSYDSEADYAIIVTAYEQTCFLPQVVQSILAMHYSNYRVYVVADNCSDGPDLRFADPRVTVLRPEQPLASNTRSHFYAIHRFVRPHERVTIVDSDNLVHPGYLKALDQYFNKGFAAVQGVRLPKNLNTLFSCLDAARDIYYHFYDGKLLFRAGASATLAGSGMAFTTHLYRQCLEHLNITGAGFDKVLQYEIVRRGYRIAFAPEAIVWDEKTSAPEQLVKQRARWINTWFRYFGFGFGLLGRGLRNLNPNQLLFGLVLLRPPLFLFLILSLACMVLNLLFFPAIGLVWAAALLVFCGCFLLALAFSDTDKRIYRSLLGIPRFMYYQVCALLKMPRANQLSVATKHFVEQEPLPSGSKAPVATPNSLL